MAKGILHVTVENIFPIIKKFLYSDKEIFLREIISNSIDATLKFKKLSKLGEAKEEINNTNIEIKVNKKKKTLSIIDKGIGMSVKEIDKYINKIAFSSAKAYITKYKDKEIIGHFGLGFYSTFMVSYKVEIFSKSYIKNIPSSYWCSDGTPVFILEEGDRKERGTEVVLYLNEDSKEFLNEIKIQSILNKYCKFMPIPIKLGYKENKKINLKIDNIINDYPSIWTKNPLLLKDKDYKSLYSKLYPLELDYPLFWIHINIEYPFNVKGILYFPIIKNNIKYYNKYIYIYSNKIFVTDIIEGIVPDFLRLLCGIIDSSDIPLNVSRSYLQSDESVKKIYKHIIKKIAYKLYSIYKNNISFYHKIWGNIKSIIEHGMLSEDFFFKKAKSFYLYETVDGKLFTLNEFIEKIEIKHMNKENNKLIILYASNKKTQHNYIKLVKDKSYEVLLIDSSLGSHIIKKNEVMYKDISFNRVDADTMENIFKKEKITISKLSKKNKINLKKILLNTIDTSKFKIIFGSLESKSFPFIITNPEFMRRMKDIIQSERHKNIVDIPNIFNLNININHDFVIKILKEYNPLLQTKIIEKALYIAMLYKNILVGENLYKFVELLFSELLLLN